MYFLFIKFEWPQVISLELKTIWNICVFSSHVWACHLLLCPGPLALMTWEAGTDSRLTLKQPPPPTHIDICSLDLYDWHCFCFHPQLWQHISNFLPRTQVAAEKVLREKNIRCQKRLELHSPQAAWDILCQHLCPTGKDCSSPGRRVLEAARARSLSRGKMGPDMNSPQ